MTQQRTTQAGHQAAQNARENKAQLRTQATAQGAASDVIAQMKGISPTAAASVGPAIDPSQGYNFAPNSRPVDLPMPGSAPGGMDKAPDGSQVFNGNMLGDAMAAMNGAPGGALPDDHDALVGAGIGGGGQPQARTPARAPAVRQGPAKREHPVLVKLKNDLGIEPLPSYDVEVGGHIWTMMTLTSGELALASRLADQNSATVSEQLMLYKMAIAAHAIVAIDGSPTYQVFGIDPPAGVHIANHLRPPTAIRFLSASMLFKFLSEDSRAALPDKLYDAYEDKCDKASAVASYLDDADARRVRFRCPEEDCGHELFVPPRIIPGTNDIVLPYCQWHGVPMELVGVQEESSYPLA
jgi:hypothetical protein